MQLAAAEISRENFARVANCSCGILEVALKASPLRITVYPQWINSSQLRSQNLVRLTAFASTPGRGSRRASLDNIRSYRFMRLPRCRFDLRC